VKQRCLPHSFSNSVGPGRATRGSPRPIMARLTRGRRECQRPSGDGGGPHLWDGGVRFAVAAQLTGFAVRYILAGGKATLSRGWQASGR